MLSVCLKKASVCFIVLKYIEIILLSFNKFYIYNITNKQNTRNRLISFFIGSLYVLFS